MSKPFKPMGAVMWEPEQCTFPKMASLKRDGIRVEIINGDLFAKSMKPLRNKNLRTHFQALLDLHALTGIVFEGEIYSHECKFKDIQSVVNSEDKPIPTHFGFHAFDTAEEDKNMLQRYLSQVEHLSGVENCFVAVQSWVESLEQVEEMFQKALADGYEGLILRDPAGPYKRGKSTVREGYALKVKPFETFDTLVTGVTQRFVNTNESQTNELGQSFKRNTKADKAPTGIASALETEYNGHPIKVVLTGDEDFRREVWENREHYIGKCFEWKGMVVGSKNVPRHPNFIRWRNDKDEE